MKQMKNIFIKNLLNVLMLSILSVWVYGQQSQNFKYTIEYNDDYSHVLTHSIVSAHYPDIMAFYSIHEFLPSRLINVKVEIGETYQIPLEEWSLSPVQNDEFEYSTDIIEVKNNYQIATYVFPYRKTSNNSIEVLLSFNVEITYEKIYSRNLRNPEATYTSVLSSGDIYKVKVDKTGLYKIDRAFLEADLGINLNNINPRQIKIYGTRGGKLPEANSSPRIDDLEELHIFVAGENDGVFDGNDHILFFAEGPDLWSFDKNTLKYTYDKNIYDDFNYYFIKIGGDNGLRIPIIENSPITPDKISSTYDYLQRFEEDKINLLGAFAQTHGSGKEWYGDVFTQGSRERNYSSKFDFSDIDFLQPLSVEMLFASRSSATHSVQLSFGEEKITGNIGSVSFAARDAGETTYARKSLISSEINLLGSSTDLKITMLDNIANSSGWLDYIQIVSKRNLNLTSGQKIFRNSEFNNVATAGFNLNNYSGQTIWDITYPLQPREIRVNDNLLSFNTQEEISVFLAHTGVNSAFAPQAVGKIPNQNLHSMKDEDLIIVYHPEFKTEAEKLAQHRASAYGLKVLLASTDEVYNEFGGGKADPTAIRDMARLLLYRNPEYSYLLLLGDASYDYKGVMKDFNFENFVPTYQTNESLSPLSAFPTDDYFGLLGQTEGVNLSGALDIHVGRLPVRNLTEAQNVVNKIIHYDSKGTLFGDWRLRTGFIADDGDNNLHVRDMNSIAKSNETRQNLHNQEKVYSDAYKLLATSGEPRFPDANRAINDNIFKGQVAVTYLGHGGPLGWAQERILTVPDIQNMTNMDALTLMITATCSFGSFDDPSLTSPAEHALLNPRGGAIALMTTSRVVFTNSNFQLTNSVHDVLFEKDNGLPPTFGRIMTFGKNKVPGINSRKFSLLGDPSQRIALPHYEIKTTHINGKDVALASDTLKALSKVTFSGTVVDVDGQKVTSFNGTLSATVFDKKSQLQTLSNTSSSPPFNFEMYKNVIFKGKVSVVNGEWSLTFWVPKTIDYRFGKGRLSLYASNDDIDAGGAFENFIVGGSNENLIADNEGPVIDAFMNDNNFVSGGITNSNPVLLLQLTDDLGINVTGNAIGQDITATLDGDNKNIFILNDFYEADKDDFTSGSVRFPLRNVSPGSHYITAKAWDISGNFTETRLDFVVMDNMDTQLKHVFNYPNPFSNRTTFQFEHDLPNTELDIVINIYSVSGKLVKSIEEIKYSSGFRVNDIFWNGNDDFDSRLSRGVYFYKITIHSKELNQTRESRFEKLVKL